MHSAKNLIIERLKTLELSINIDAVTSKSLTDKQHNDIARLLRNGLAVVGFNALEDFIKSRTSEVLSEIGKTGISFNYLPERLQYSSTCDAIKAINYQLSLKEKPDRITYIQEQALIISSTANSTYELFPQSFGYDIPNLREDTIKEILKNFLIDDAWREMSALGSKIGLIALPLNETFKNAATRRHKAAHIAQADTPQNDIKQFVNEAFAISITFDCLITKAFSFISRRDSAYLSGKVKINNSKIKTRIVKHTDNKWKEYVNGNLKAYRTSLNKDQLVIDARKRAKTNEELFIVFDNNSIIDYWDCF